MRITSLFTFAILFILVSCKKKEGCTDLDATNYDESAKIDDKSCVYKGSLVLWYKSGVFTGLASTGVTNLNVYVNGQFAMQHPVGGYNNTVPDCGMENTITVEVDLGIKKSETYPFEVYDQNDNLLWSGEISVSGNTCTSKELVW